MPLMSNVRRHKMPLRSTTFVLLLALAAANSIFAQQPKLDCSKGPLQKTFGSTAWLVYACSDGKSVVAVTAPNSPASHFYFLIYPKDGRYVVVGEGTGPKEIADRAYVELMRLKEADIAALVAAASKLEPTDRRQ